jgi:ornithine racemase
MIELGDLREGVLGEDLIAFYEAVFQLPGIRVTAIGANLNCLHGVMPSQDKLIQLSLYKQLIELKYQRKIPWVTGGTSVVIPLLLTHQVPRGINHFRVGESLFFGNDLVHGTPLEGMRQDIFTLYAEIIEIQEKPVVPSGVLEANPSGETYTIQPEDYGRTIYRAIIDIGLLDVSPDFLIPEDERIRVMGASSDMLVLELGEDNLGYQVGDLLNFRLRYMGLLGIMNSRYVEKTLV